jgi:hypothetical protein
MENLLPAAKNIGTTQSRTDVTGCTLWNGNVGEAAGALTAYCLMKAMSPTAGAKHTEAPSRLPEDAWL